MDGAWGVSLVNLPRPPSDGEPCCSVGRVRSAVVLVVIFVVFIYLFVGVGASSFTLATIVIKNKPIGILDGVGSCLGWFSVFLFRL